MRTEPVRVALIGCGAVSQIYHAPALIRSQDDVEVAALYDPDTESYEGMAAHFPAARRMQSPEDLSGCQLAIVASPPGFHAGQTIGALSRGVAVLCEKPMATSADEAERMVATAESTGRPLAIGLVRRFLPATQTIRRLLQANALGTVETIECFEGGPFRWPARSASFFQNHAAGGGVLLDIGVHALDTIVWWMGMPVYIEYADDAIGGVEANCEIKMEFAEGAVASVRLSRDWERPNRYEVRCSNGRITWTVNEADNFEMQYDKAPEVMRIRLESGRTQTFERSFDEQIRNVAGAVRGQNELQVPASEAVLSMRCVDECLARRSLMPMGWLTTGELSRAFTLSGLVTS